MIDSKIENDYSKQITLQSFFFISVHIITLGEIITIDKKRR